MLHLLLSPQHDAADGQFSGKKSLLCGNLCSTAAAGPLVRLRLQSDVDVLRKRNYDATHGFGWARYAAGGIKNFLDSKLGSKITNLSKYVNVTLNYLVLFLELAVRILMLATFYL